MMAGSIALGVEARLAKTDAVLLFTIVLAMGVLARAYLLPRDEPARQRGAGCTGRCRRLFWTALAAGILDKGPLIVMVVGLAAAALSILDRSARWLNALRPLRRIALARCIWSCPGSSRSICAPATPFWSIPSATTCCPRSAAGRKPTARRPGLYILLFFVTFFPASALAVPAVPAIWSARPRACRLVFFWPGWFRRGSYSNWFRPNCRITCCRFIPRSPS